MKKKNKVLIYCGANHGVSLNKIYKNFGFCYVFEANPELVIFLKNKFKNVKNVEIIEGALSEEHNKEVDFHITYDPVLGDNQMHYSSSLGELSDYYRNNGPKNQVTTLKTITVKTINLYTFLQERNIKKIHTYISDLEGMDFTVLKTIRYYIDNKLIINIQIETETDGWEKMAHLNLSSNKQKDIINFLSKNYNIVKYQKGNYNLKSENRWFHQDVFFRVKD
jgi:FkbM family methyltransferase